MGNARPHRAPAAAPRRRRRRARRPAGLHRRARRPRRRGRQSPLGRARAHLAARCLATRCASWSLAAWVAWAACCRQLAARRGRPRPPRRGRRCAERLGPGPGRGADRRRRARAHHRRRTPRTRPGRRRCQHARATSGAGPRSTAGARPWRRHVARSRHGRDATPCGRATRCGASRDDRLGDGADWTALAALNLGRDMGGGTRFVDPDHVQAGWRLRLPADATTPTAATGRRRDTVAGTTGRGPRNAGTICPSWSRSAWARWPAPRWPVAPARRRRRSVHRRARDAAARCPRAPSTRRRCCTASRASRHCARSRPPTASSGRSLHGRRRPRRSVPSASRRPASRSGSPAPQADAARWLRAACGRRGLARRPRRARGRRPLLSLRPHRPPRRGRRGGHLAGRRSDRDDVLPLLGEVGAGALARGRRGRGACLGVVGHGAGDRRPRRPGAPGRGRRGPVAAPAPSSSSGTPRSLPGRRRRSAAPSSPPRRSPPRPDRPGRPPGGHAPPDGPGRAAPAPVRRRRPGTSRSSWCPAPAADPAAAAAVPGEPAPGPRAAARRRWRPGPVDVRLLTMTPRLDGLARGPPAQPGPAGGRARRLPGPAPARRRHRATGCARACSGRPTPTPRRRRCSTRRTRRGGPWASTSTAIPSSRRHPQRPVPGLAPGDRRRAPSDRTGRRGEGAAASPTVAIAYYRAALELVEGEPLANALSGYSWWEAEGHGGRVAAVLVDAACTMAALASDAGHFDLARWGLERARLVEPYSEALSRAAMELRPPRATPTVSASNGASASAGSMPLDPGSSPSPRTESLYGELSRRVLVDAGAPRGAPAALRAGRQRLNAGRRTRTRRTTSSRRATRLPLTSTASPGPERLQQRDGVVDAGHLGRAVEAGLVADDLDPQLLGERRHAPVLGLGLGAELGHEAEQRQLPSAPAGPPASAAPPRSRPGWRCSSRRPGRDRSGRGAPPCAAASRSPSASADTTPSNGTPHHSAAAAAASALGTCCTPCSASRTSPLPHGVDEPEARREVGVERHVLGAHLGVGVDRVAEHRARADRGHGGHAGIVEVEDGDARWRAAPPRARSSPAPRRRGRRSTPRAPWPRWSRCRRRAAPPRARRAMWPAPRAPISRTTHCASSGALRRVRGRPSSLLKERSLAAVGKADGKAAVRGGPWSSSCPPNR